ncbi:hypothetical protein GCM10028814_19350 [Angustibacter aerolatus]
MSLPPLPSGGRGRGRRVDTAALSSCIEEFARTVTGEFDAPDILRQLVLSATQVLQVDGGGVMAPSDAGTELLRMVFAVSGPLGELDELQEVLDQGPCRHAFEVEQVVNLADVRTEGNWPQYMAAADELGVRAVACVPLLARGRRWGVLDLYRYASTPLSEEELAAAATLASLATSYLVVADDRDRARRAQHALTERAMHDTLTGLPVRWVFLEQLDHALTRLHRADGLLGVLFCDLDGLKYVNDTYGHLAGDRLIRTAVDRVRAALRPADVLARIGGDEFVVLLEDLATADAAAVVAQRVLQEVAAPWQLDGHDQRLSMSIGVAVTDDPAAAGDALISHADAAMYRAKRAGPGRAEVFDSKVYAADRAASEARERFADDLRDALDAGQLEVHYQPVVHLTEHDPGGPAWGDPGLPHGGHPVHAVEALLRWRHPTRGLLVADDFIATAARSGLLPQLGRWVLRSALDQLRDWQRELGARAPGHVLVNVSAGELLAPGFVAEVQDALTAGRTRPGRLTVEVTESDLFADVDAALQAVNAVRQLGCQVALDDFGVGHSSLSRLLELPADVLKVDRAFIRTVPGDPGAEAVLAAVLALGRDLARTVVVEGVETATTLHALRDAGVRYAQGYYFTAALPAGELSTRLRAGTITTD